MENCKSAQLQLFRLRSSKCVNILSVSSWIHKAVTLNVCEVDIQSVIIELPLSLFTCKTLTKLRLSGICCDHNEWECPSSVCLPCLKTLDIVGYNKYFVNAFKLICGCPVLENLSLEGRVLKEEEDYVFNIPTLKRLNLTLVKQGCLFNEVILNVPNLEYLFVGGKLCSFFRMEDVSSLVEASFSFCERTIDNVWVQLLEGINGVKSLSIEHVSSFIDFKYKYPFAQPLPIFLNMKQLELNGFRHSIFQLLELFPKLKHLYVKKLEDSGWNELRRVPACMLTDLTTIKFSICKWQKCDIEFLEYMLGNAKVLKTVTITWENSSIEDYNKQLIARFLKFLPKASRCCAIRSS